MAVAESAVIGYPHEIKGEGKMLAFLSLKCLSWRYCTAVGSGTVTPTPGSSAEPMPCSMLVGNLSTAITTYMRPPGPYSVWQQQHYGQKHLQLRLQSITSGYQWRGTSPSTSCRALRSTLCMVLSNLVVLLQEPMHLLC